MILEAMAIRDGIRLASERGYQAVEIESAAQEVINLIEGPEGQRSVITRIRQEIMELKDIFASFKLLFVSRLANEASHLCAKRASSARRILWVNYTPDFLADRKSVV